LDEGLILERVSCPIGVLLIIFEARPEVIANIAALAIKSGNAAILKGNFFSTALFISSVTRFAGGKESINSFIAISTVISEALATSAVPNSSIQLLTTRDSIPALLGLDTYIDLVIPRGSNELVRYIKSSTKIPVLGHADGLCSIYIAADADPKMAARILIDAKTSYVSACNAVETLIVDHATLTTILPTVAAALCEAGVFLRCDADSLKLLLQNIPPIYQSFLSPSIPADYNTEFLSLTLAILTLPPGSPEESLSLAISHVNTHSSHHTDAIITANSTRAARFQDAVDSGCVFWNTSTRMSDGMRFGFGTEVGVSTNKIHARGPVGVEGLMVYKYKVMGNGQVTEDYGVGGKKWLHERMALD
jgi:glutamate-5-semialdehyde dehydrogenase